MATYRIALHWNNQRVLSGECSAVLAWENVRHLMIENFAGDTRKEGEARCPALVDVANAPIGTRFADTIGDETGTARYSIERIA